jgi:hypothetical protein
MVRNVAWARWFHASLSATLRSIVPAPRGRERDLAHAPLPERHDGANDVARHGTATAPPPFLPTSRGETS